MSLVIVSLAYFTLVLLMLLCFVTQEGFTPLTVAVREDRIEMAEYLLKEAADVNSLDREQRPVLNKNFFVTRGQRWQRVSDCSELSS